MCSQKKDSRNGLLGKSESSLRKDLGATLSGKGTTPRRPKRGAPGIGHPGGVRTDRQQSIEGVISRERLRRKGNLRPMKGKTGSLAKTDRCEGAQTEF